MLPRVFAKSALLFVVYTGMNYDAYAIWFPEGLKWLINNIATRVEIRTITSYRDKRNLYYAKTHFCHPNYIAHNKKVNSTHRISDAFIFQIDAKIEELKLEKVSLGEPRREKKLYLTPRPSKSHIRGSAAKWTSLRRNRSI